MALISDLVSDVASEVADCPVSHIERMLNRVIRDFCYKTHYWQHDMEPLTLLPFNPKAADTYIYTLPIPSQTELIAITEIIYKNNVLGSKSAGWLDEHCPNWRNSVSEPNYYLTMSNRQVRFVPASDQVRPVSISGTLILQPDRKAKEFSDELMLFDSHIINGVLSKLMLMPGKAWSNERRATICEAVYQEGVSQARMDVIRQFSTGVETIEKRSWLWSI